MATREGVSITPEGMVEIADAVPTKGKKEQPAFRIYEGSKIAVSKATGPLFQKKYSAAKKAYEYAYEAWQEVFAYFNNNQTKGATTPEGHFHRGDGTENVVYANVNLMIPAVYSKNPDFEINTTDEEDKDFVIALKALINALFKRRDYLHGKPKLKKAVGLSLLTNFGAFKLDYVQKEQSREAIVGELARISEELKKAKKQDDVESLYGQLMALEAQAEVAENSGPRMMNVYPHKLLIDPNAEDMDGCDGQWMMEPVLIATNYLRERFTMKGQDGESVLVYKPTHKVSVTGDTKDDGTAAVVSHISEMTTTVDSYTDDTRLDYQYDNMTECVYVWDKVTRRLFLFLEDDWTWPIWVWEDPLKLSRFFPYFTLPFSFSTGGPITVGEASYYLDQQDEINTINRQVANIRRVVFNYIFYDSNIVPQDVAEKLNRALKGEQNADAEFLGVPVEEGKSLKDLLHALVPPSTQLEALFNKEPILNTINRVTNTSDALRGAQFKTNTNEAAVQSYQDSVRLSVGAKVDVLEDALSDAGHALAELCVQFMDQDTVAGIIGQRLAKGWRTMEVGEFNANYSCEVVAGSTEKPNSTFKKKESIQIAQAVGQFAQAAPGATLRIMLKVLQQAFSEVAISKSDWDAIDQEVSATLTKGVSQPGAGNNTGEQQSGPSPEDEMAQMRNAPPDVKARVVQMRNEGRGDQEIVDYLRQAMNGRPGPSANPQGESEDG